MYKRSWPSHVYKNCLSICEGFFFKSDNVKNLKVKLDVKFLKTVLNKNYKSLNL
jgi:hypothetical protein